MHDSSEIIGAAITSRPLAEAVSRYAHSGPVRFHVPGHKGRGFAGTSDLGLFDALLPYDVTELGGLDDLAAPDGPIAGLERRLAKVYGAQRSFLLVGGSTVGLQAAVMATAGDGATVVVPRDVHRSVIAGIVLAGATPYYIVPEVDEVTGLTLGAPSEAYSAAFQACIQAGHPAVAAVATNPSYFGTCSDLRSIAALCRAYGATFIVDEAHGPHLQFTPGAPPDGMLAEADIVVHSPHKTLASMTQSAWMHVQGPRVDPEVVKSRLLLLQTSSPSYLLMCSLETSIALLEGSPREHMSHAAYLADRVKCDVERLGMLVHFQGRSTDPTRVFFSAHSLGLAGEPLAELLTERRIFPELANSAGCLLIVTPGNAAEDVDALAEALGYIAAASPGSPLYTRGSGGYYGSPGFSAMAPRAAALAPCETVPLEAAVGRISAGFIAPSPPSIALLLPGDLITAETVKVLGDFSGSGLRVHGASDPSLSTIRVVL